MLLRNTTDAAVGTLQKAHWEILPRILQYFLSPRLVAEPKKRVEKVTRAPANVFPYLRLRVTGVLYSHHEIDVIGLKAASLHHDPLISKGLRVHPSHHCETRSLYSNITKRLTPVRAVCKASACPTFVQTYFCVSLLQRYVYLRLCCHPHPLAHQSKQIVLQVRALLAGPTLRLGMFRCACPFRHELLLLWSLQNANSSRGCRLSHSLHSCRQRSLPVPQTRSTKQTKLVSW